MIADRVIWDIDALWMILAMGIAGVGVSAACGSSRAIRALLLVVILVLLGAYQVFIPVRLERDPWVVSGLGLAVAAACLGPSRYLTSLLVLVSLAVAIAGIGACPVGILGLLHHVALIDLSGIGLAVLGQGVFGNRSFNSASEPDANPLPRVECLGPTRLERRAAIHFGLLCSILAWAMYREVRIFDLPAWLGWWASISEIVAAAVSWQVIRAWLAPANATKRQSWAHRTGLIIAGISALLALVLIPILLSSAATLR